MSDAAGAVLSGAKCRRPGPDKVTTSRCYRNQTDEYDGSIGGERREGGGDVAGPTIETRLRMDF